MPRVYATSAELADYAPADVTLPSEAETSRMLARASEAVEVVTLTAVYPVDEQHMPTDTVHSDALRDATCAQVVHWLQTGDESGGAGQWSSVSIGSVSLSRPDAGANGSTAATVPDAVSRPLRLAGLLPGAVRRP